MPNFGLQIYKKYSQNKCKTTFFSTIWHLAHFSISKSGKQSVMQQSKIAIYSPCRFAAAMVAEIVADSRAQVVCYSSIEQLLSAYGTHAADMVIILDIKPFINGEELTSKLRQKRGKPLIYVVAWQQSEQTVLSLLECGVDQYMTFPICMSRLRGKSQNAMCDE